MQQDRLIGRRGRGPVRAPSAAGRAGRSTATPARARAAAAREVERLDLGPNRSALGRSSTLPAARPSLVVVTHLHHLVPDEAMRDEQAAALSTWLEAAPATDAGRGRRLQRRAGGADVRADASRAGFRSASAEANGADPAVTWPSGLQAPAMDTDGDPDCLDYIWVRGAVRVESRAARLRPAGPSTTRRSTRATTSASPRGSRSVGDADARPDAPARASRRLASRPGELARGDRRPRWRSPACDGLEFDVRSSFRRRAGAPPRRDARARPGAPRPRRRPDRRGARRVRRADARGGPRGGRRRASSMSS